MTESWDSTGKFNREAFLWDDNPQRRFLADAAAMSIIAAAIPQNRWQALEIGCGTGLVSLAIAPLVERVTAINTSREMLEVLQYKAGIAGISNIRTHCSDLDLFSSGTGPEEKFDLIYCSMTLHHIEDTAGCIRIFSRHLSPDGIIAIADLEPEDGRFHEDPEENVHRGFERSSLSALFRQNGLQETSYSTIHIIRKTNRDGVAAEYPVFLVTASRSF
jgi:2-polyprenyl-3-methyl-5-hydroxy-6-metoxy-1,4-benzoquinol methylase